MINNKTVNDFYSSLLETIKNSKEVVYRYYDKSYTYQELYSYMLMSHSLLSHYKRKQVVLYASKELPTYATIFSIFLSNNIWLPLSPENPESRNQEILKQAEPALVIHDGTLPESLLKYFSEKNIECVTFDEAFSCNEKKEFESGVFKKDDIAYIMFTSGSTGTPKGVPMSHENYINFIRNVLKILPFGKNEVFSDFHDFAFDISIFYLFACPLTQGAFSPIIEEKDKIIPINHIQSNDITVWSSVPSVINRIRAFRPNNDVDTPIKIMFLCGEPLKFDVLKYCFHNMGLENIYNFYGLTETGVENFYHQCKKEDVKKYDKFGVSPIGKPLKGNEIRVTDEKELYIGGVQVTKGYLGGRSPEKFEEKDGILWCKTGDIVEKEGEVYFCKGRLDSQVKLSGYRVELMDIETHIRKIESVEEAVCFVEEVNRRTSLIAAIKAKVKMDIKTIQSELKKRLPVYMIPKDIYYLDNIPLTNSGKIDKKKVRLIYSRNNS